MGETSAPSEETFVVVQKTKTLENNGHHNLKRK